MGEVIGGTRGNVVLGKIIVSVLGFNVIHKNIIYLKLSAIFAIHNIQQSMSQAHPINKEYKKMYQICSIMMN